MRRKFFISSLGGALALGLLTVSAQAAPTQFGGLAKPVPIHNSLLTRTGGHGHGGGGHGFGGHGFGGHHGFHNSHGARFFWGGPSYYANSNCWWSRRHHHWVCPSYYY